MRTLCECLADYARYHRDPRNIATHFVGVPLIVMAVVVLLSRPVLVWQTLQWTPALPAVLTVVWFYLRLDRRYGLVMALLLALAMRLGAATAGLATGAWLALGVGAFVVGWAIQFAGHIFEGRKPAFLDDLSSLLVGPLFVVAEAGFRLGLRRGLSSEIERRIAGSL